ncbi:MAG TPA: class II aldolase/adducin family protein [Acidobacteriaceae bacterium]|nr:class II aldolase/adducin family protein [Acidobacteriaceae bacterium]
MADDSKIDSGRNLNSALISEIVRAAVEQCLAVTEPPAPASESPTDLFHSSRARAIKEEIIRAGRKLWERQYVDGNGGNISARISRDYILCTPTLVSKGDLHIDDISLVDLENCQICGNRAQTSEIRLHLEIYKAVPQAKAVIHCHPPYATAHAIADVVPQGNLLPEQEVFIGPVVIAPYETPGTTAFARTVLPWVRRHNTILLSHHGIVCWADTVTHAEWYTEVIDTYCKTVMIARQLRPDLTEIPPDKIEDLLAFKKRIDLSLPDARLPVDESPVAAGGALRRRRSLSDDEIDSLVASLTNNILRFFEKA